ncbi:MAG: thioredoxin domain-containing protein [Nitrospira sp.]|nr:thioredoxin domain-containing protein [Candidatus Manganitrophaceae bacterium]HIL35649.1 thioredoxin domain-containing protein [Candidatus Manganitrophaceae bacterium]
MEEHRFTNRLIEETSPYLQQHAHNPVDWVPWGDEAFETARRENKPVLLSIGYSACHWCHVMETESFENEAIARIMNAGFVNIKVDLEERPDLDQIYQNAVQLFIRRGGGWPLTMFLTPDKVPFHGGTYFPPEDRYGMPGFPKLLALISETYREKQDDISLTVRDVKKALDKMSGRRAEKSGQPINPQLLEGATSALERIFDEENGGFGTAPKFPSTPALSLLLRQYQKSGNKDILQRVTLTLDKMASGGIYDQLGGGFHRYSTDAHWLVPHFEKMLYDNAQLARLYFQTCQATGQALHMKIGEEILEYVEREMTDPLGGFYSTQDADTEGHEGKYFVWTPDEINGILGDEVGDIFCRHYDVSSAGNFEGKNILNITQSILSLFEDLGESPESLEKMISEARKKLLQERTQRIKPFRDEKIITSWNSLMISAFVDGYLVTGKESYLTAAKKATDFILTALCKEGRLLRTYKDGTGKLNAYLEDYAFFIDALLDLYEATFESTYLEKAKNFTTQMINQFYDLAEAGFFYTSRDHETLVTRYKASADQSIPSGNAVAIQVLLRLFYLSGEKNHLKKAELTLKLFSQAMGANVFGMGNMIAVADFYLRKPKEILLLGKRESPETKDLLSKIHRLHLPNKVLFFRDIDEKADFPSGPNFPEREKTPTDGLPTITICHNFTCSLPMTDWNTIKSALSTR